MNELDILRKKIDDIDKELLKVFEERLFVCKEIAEYKRQNELSVLDKEREKAVIQSRCKLCDIPEAEKFIKCVIEISREYQERLLDKK